MMTDAERECAIHLVREHLVRQLELVPCEKPRYLLLAHDDSEYLIFGLPRDRPGTYLGGSRYLAIHVPTGHITEQFVGE